MARAADRLAVAYLAVVVAFVVARADGRDARAYWALDVSAPYAASVGQPGAFVYPPPVAALAAPLGVLPWPVFHALWTVLLVGCLVYVLGRRGAALALLPLLLFPVWREAPLWPVWRSIWVGNVELVLAAALVAAFRGRRTWPVLILAKPTAAVAGLWHVARAEWTAVRSAALTTLAVVAPTLLLPGWWADWFGIAASGTAYDYLGAPPLWVRLALACLVVVAAARFGLRWPVAVAVALSMPIMWVNSLAVLVAAWPLRRATVPAAPVPVRRDLVT